MYILYVYTHVYNICRHSRFYKCTGAVCGVGEGGSAQSHTHSQRVQLQRGSLQLIFNCDTFSKVSSILIVHGKFGSELTFENIYPPPNPQNLSRCVFVCL